METNLYEKLNGASNLWYRYGPPLRKKEGYHVSIC
jgi:hypothetical protein